MIKVAILSGRQKNGTLLPREERHVWKEVQRIISEDLSNLGKNFEYLIPVYTKFDLEVLRIAERNGNKVTYYLPNENWGKTSLPTFQLNLISRMRKPGTEVIVDGPMMARIYKMIEDADIVYYLDETDGFERFKDSLAGKNLLPFSKDKMLYQTEEEAKVYHEELKQKTTIFITPDDLRNLEDKQLEDNLSSEEEDITQMLQDVYYPGESGDNQGQLSYEEHKSIEELAIDVDAWIKELDAL